MNRHGMDDSLLVNEVFCSIQGEGTRAGLACVFVRLTGCHLRCAYCDTEHAFHEGQRRAVDDVVAEVESFGCDLVEITGGEPLLQAAVHGLMSRLCDAGRTVLVETDGACDISACDPRAIRIMDIKTPASGEADRNLWTNITHLTSCDEVKLVICDRGDYEWSRDVVRRHDLPRRVSAVLFSAASFVAPGTEIAGVAGLAIRDLAQWVLADRLGVRLQAQLHKLIWDPTTRGV
jgi:7-carboxy-7-deazaguanine synthase